MGVSAYECFHDVLAELGVVALQCGLAMPLAGLCGRFRLTISRSMGSEKALKSVRFLAKPVHWCGAAAGLVL